MESINKKRNRLSAAINSTEVRKQDVTKVGCKNWYYFACVVVLTHEQVSQ